MGDFEEYIIKVGENIVQARKAQNIKQVELAARLGMEDSSLRRIEKGRTNPTIKYLYRIARELNVSITDLIKEE